ncbi:palmitoyltransferase for Vac8p [Podila horticola]|nr:palmitoyltransferase for Vac8p [Podila horticola]
MIRMTERSPHHQQPLRQQGHDADDEEDDDDVPLGRFRLAHSRFTVKSDGKMRYCQKCNFEKPDRTHHCKSCKRCVLKMDHRLHDTRDSHCYQPSLSVIFGLCLVPFAIQHILLMKDNRTTIESFEKHKYRTGTQGQVMQSRLLNVFDLGKKQNFIQVLGPVWYLWLIPVRNSIGNGWSFPASEFGKQMLERDTLESVTVHNGSSLNHGQGHGHHDGHYHDSPSPAWPAQGMMGSEQEEDYGDDDGMDLTMTGTYSSRRESDVSDDEGRGFFDPGTPRRFRQGGFAPMYQGSEDEAEEELYDSDEPATIHFTRL